MLGTKGRTREFLKLLFKVKQNKSHILSNDTEAQGRTIGCQFYLTRKRTSLYIAVLRAQLYICAELSALGRAAMVQQCLPSFPLSSLPQP